MLDTSEGSKGFVPLNVTSDEQRVIREKMVVALRDITDGKIFLEAERARLTRALAIIKVRAIHSYRVTLYQIFKNRMKLLISHTFQYVYISWLMKTQGGRR